MKDLKAIFETEGCGCFLFLVGIGFLVVCEGIAKYLSR